MRPPKTNPSSKREDVLNPGQVQRRNHKATLPPFNTPSVLILLKTYVVTNKLTIVKNVLLLTVLAWVDFLGLQMTWICYEFYHLKATKRDYSRIYTKSKAQQSCAVTFIFAGVLTVPTVLPKITKEGCVIRPLVLSSVLSTSELARTASAPTPRWRLSWLKLLMVTTMSQSSTFGSIVLPKC